MHAQARRRIIKKKKKKKRILSQADVYLDKSNCDKVTLQQQQSMEVIYLPHGQFLLCLQTEGGRTTERSAGGALASVGEQCGN